MIRPSPRESVLLCSPLLLIGGVGFMLSRRKPPTPDEDKLRLDFHVEKPTTLEAFQGVDAALVVEIKGSPSDQIMGGGAVTRFELQTAKGMKQVPGWSKGIKSSGTRTKRYLVNVSPVPPGVLRLGIDMPIFTMSGSALVPTKAPLLHGQWTIPRAQIQPVAFENIARPVFVVLRSVKITRDASYGRAGAECEFELTGAAMDAGTLTDFNFSGIAMYRGMRVNGSSGWGPVATDNPKRRVWECTLDRDSTFAAPSSGTIGRFRGRISVDNRWPLAFESEPFNYAKVKIGQQLKFKSWPVPRLTP